MDLEGITVSDISQTEEDKYHIFSLTRGLKKKPENSQVQGTVWFQKHGSERMGQNE